MNSKPLRWNPTGQQFLSNPYTLYKRLQAESPIFQATTGDFVLTRYEHIKKILQNSKDFSVGARLKQFEKHNAYLKDKFNDFQELENISQGILMLLNPPQHMRLRKLVREAWKQKQVENTVSEILNDIFRKVKPGKRFDFVEKVAQVFPAKVIQRILGLPDSDLPFLVEHSKQLVKILDLYLKPIDIERLLVVSRELNQYFKNVLNKKRVSPKEDLISELLKHSEVNQELSATDSELISLFSTLLVAGEETTQGLLSSMVRNLGNTIKNLNNGEAPINYDVAVEEFLRYDPPVHNVVRTTNTELSFGQVSIPKGSIIICCLAAANRDPHIFAEPDLINLNRHPNPHLSFGAGSHYCLGDWLARMQARLLLEYLFNHYSTIKVYESELAWNEHSNIRTLTRLPVEFY